MSDSEDVTRLRAHIVRLDGMLAAARAGWFEARQDANALRARAKALEANLDAQFLVNAELKRQLDVARTLAGSLPVVDSSEYGALPQERSTVVRPFDYSDYPIINIHSYRITHDP